MAAMPKSAVYGFPAVCTMQLVMTVAAKKGTGRMQPRQPDRISATSDLRATSQHIEVVPGALLTAEQVAQLLGVPRTWVYEQSRSGRIPTVTLGRYRRYRREAIEAWVRELEAPPRAAVHARGKGGR